MMLWTKKDHDITVAKIIKEKEANMKTYKAAVKKNILVIQM